MIIVHKVEPLGEMQGAWQREPGKALHLEERPQPRTLAHDTCVPVRMHSRMHYCVLIHDTYARM
eukprot:1162076-Pelagomonas_calceolata.AAC.3